MDLLENGTVVYTDCQTGGKGTKGRSWEIAPGDAIAFSFVLKNCQPQDLSFLPLICGLAEIVLFQKLSVSDAGIKWPNDIVVHQKKVSGILCESTIEGSSIHVVCGIGINLHQTQNKFEQQQLTYATSLWLETQKNYTMEEILSGYLEEFNQLWKQYQKLGFVEGILPQYQKHCITLGKQVRVLFHQVEKQGKAVAISDTGQLICEIDGKQQYIHHGEASIRGLWGYI